MAIRPLGDKVVVKPSEAEDKDRAVAGGGVKVPGWTGKVDSKSAAQGRTLNDSKFEQQGDAIHMAIGPAAYYYNPANTVKGEGVSFMENNVKWHGVAPKPEERDAALKELEALKV